MKTPEEIKKRIKCFLKSCYGACNMICGTCEVYEAGYSLSASCSDALVYIQQLEEREKSLYAALHAVMYIVDKWLDVEPYDFDKDDGTVAITRASEAREVALRVIENAERERKALMHDVSKCRRCETCAKRRIPIHKCPHFDGGTQYPCWQWRGPCPENTKEE